MSTKAKEIIGIIGVAVLTLPAIYVAAYFFRGQFVREPLVSFRVFESRTEMHLYGPLIKIEDYIRENLWGEEFLPHATDSN
jgi:hypothetical protein